MEFSNITDDPEDTEHTPAERAAAASRSTWVSVAVNVGLSATQIVVGVLAKSQGLIAGGIHSLSDLISPPGVSGLHDVRTRKMGDMTDRDHAAAAAAVPPAALALPNTHPS